MKKKILCLAIAAVMAAGIVETAYAEEFKSEKDWYVNFDGEKMNSNFSSREMAQEYVKMGFYIGVGGVVTFKNGRKLKETVAEIPLESIVLETDCPYLAPEPYRGKRNHSAYIRYVAETIAEIKGVTYEEVVAQTEENARKMYRL